MPASSPARVNLVDAAAPVLQSGEQVVVVDGEPAVDFWKARRATRALPTPEGVRFDKGQMGVVVTTRRLLMFEVGGFPEERARELMTDVPVARVDSIVAIGHSFRSFEVRLTIDGVEYGFILAHVGRGRRMATALEIAKQASS